MFGGKKKHTLEFVLIVAVAAVVIGGVVGYYIGLGSIFDASLKHAGDGYNLTEEPLPPDPPFVPADEKLDRSQWHTYTSAGYDYTIQYPETWVVVDSRKMDDQNTLIVTFAPKNKSEELNLGYEPFVVEISDCSEATVEDCVHDEIVAGAIRNMETAYFNDVFNESTGAQVAIATPIAERWVYLIKKNDRLFRLSYLTWESEIEVFGHESEQNPEQDRYNTIVRNMLDSFRFTD